MGWIFNAVYGLLIALLTPVWLYRIVVLKKNRDGWRQKFLGRLPKQTAGRNRIWCHAVSVGEVLQLKPLLAEWKRRNLDCDVVITTTTTTGLEVARKTFPNDVVCYFPFDLTWAVKTALKRIAPTQIVLVELELWPNFIRATSQANIPLALVNGRMSERSFRGYSRLRLLMRPLLQRISVIAVQSQTYADRLIALGASPQRVKVTGSIKFDGLSGDRHSSTTQALRTQFGLADDDVVLIAGSTQAPEEAMALATYQTLSKRFPSLRLILVPRHQERFDDVAQLVINSGHAVLRRTKGLSISTKSVQSAVATDRPVILLDTLGELNACWGLADIAYVGGSMHVGRGGQNMMEPAAYGAAVLFGPDTRNFRDVVALLLQADAAIVVRNSAEFTQHVDALLSNPARAARMGAAARRLVFAQQGATSLTLDLLQPARTHSQSTKAA